MKRIIITGTTGFVGQNVVEYLLTKGLELYAVVRSSSKTDVLQLSNDRLNIFVYDGELQSLITFFIETKADAVIHLASLFIAEHDSKDIDPLVQSNLGFGTHILEAMRVSGTHNLLNTGTSWQHYHTDDYNPVCLYAATKQAFEALVEYYVQAENFKVITLKLFDTYGETDTRPKLINLLHKFADEGIELKMSAGEQMLNLVHIDDVNNAFFMALERLNDTKEKGHERYAVRAEKSFKLKEVIQIFEKVTHKKVNILWGGRPYRNREVMHVWESGTLLPNWSALVPLEVGLNRY